MKGWKTVIFGVSVALLSILSDADMRTFAAAHLPWLGSATGVIVIVLRWVTTSPIFRSGA